jgi:cystathionine beta-lyase/cystathionine gamma-synthase
MTPAPVRERRRGGADKFREIPEWVGPTTRILHGAHRPDWNAGAVVAPIYQTSTFHFPDEFSESADRGGTYLYTRNENPTIEVATEMARQLERAEAARLFASGMGAIAATVQSLVAPGDEVLQAGLVYGGTTDLLNDLLPRFGVKRRMLSDDEAQVPESAVRPETRLVILESPTNPTLRVHDIARWAAAADRAGALLLVDNTFATPVNQRPLDLGADLVVESATKYLGGHSDLMAGLLAGPAGLVHRVDPLACYGATPDPFATFLLCRSLKTLPLRVARQNENGARVAAAAATHPAVRRVHYPGTASDEDEAIAARQMKGRGGVLSLTLNGGGPAVDQFLRGLRFAHVASSLGSVETLVSVPLKTSHRRLSRESLRAAGIDAGMVRLSLGIEEPDDLVRDITEALDAVEGPPPSAPL